MEGQHKTLHFSFLQQLIRIWGTCDSGGGQRRCSRSFWIPAIMFGKVIRIAHISVKITFCVECNTLSWRPLAHSISFPFEGSDNETLQRNIWNLIYEYLQKIILGLHTIWSDVCKLLITNMTTTRNCVPNVYWTVHHCNSWQMKDQLDVTCYFISLNMRSTCFGH